MYCKKGTVVSNLFIHLILITFSYAETKPIQKDQILKLLHQGIRFQKSNNFEKAIETYYEVLSISPNHPDALHLCGIAHHYIGGRKIDDLQHRISSISPDLLSTYQRNEKQAEKLVRQAIQVKPHDSNFYNTLGEIIRLNHNNNINKPNQNKYMKSRLKEAVKVYRDGIDVLIPGFLDMIKNNPVRDFKIYQFFHTADGNGSGGSDKNNESPGLTDLVKNYGLCLMQLGDEHVDYTIIYYENLLKLSPNYLNYQFNLAMNLRRKNNNEDYVRAQNIFKYIVKKHPELAEAKMQLAITFQLQGRIGDAINVYNEIIKARNHHNSEIVEMDEVFVQSLTNEIRQTVMVNLGAAHQESGHFKKAIYLYRRNLEELPSDARAWNNLGSSLWQIGDAKGSVDAYMKAIDIDPDSSEAYVNLGVAYYEYGKLQDCADAYNKAYSLTKNDGLLIRLATMTLPIMISIEQIKLDRYKLKNSVMNLYDRIAEDVDSVYVDEPVKDIERVHFYFVYHGMNEIFHQIMMCNLYFNSAKHVLPFVSNYLSYDPLHLKQRKLGGGVPPHTLMPQLLPNRQGKIVVGFVSKFLVINHAHGQLLEGIIKHLDRNIFYVVALAIPNPQNVLLPSIENSADYIVRLPFALKEVRSIISDLKLDILVFADMLSEPLTYFLGLGSRMAPIQCLFWGNPITSGTPDNIDYFITGEWMEEEGMGGRHDTMDPRTDNIGEGDENPVFIATQYSEQAVRLRGQGIWYDRIPIPSNINDPNGFETVNSKDMEWPWQNEADSVTYVCAQSLFKLHPHYDEIIQKILEGTPNSYLVLLQGRRPTWTEMIQNRMKSTMSSSVFKRIYFTPRVGNSNDYLRILNKADIILHPFPFGGSKTSADAILLNIPTVVLVTDKLRCRMAYSFFVTMNIYDTVVYNENAYIRKAVELGLNKSLRKEISNKMKEKSDKIWERREVLDAWSLFFKRAYRSSAINQLHGWNGVVKSFSINLPKPPVNIRVKAKDVIDGISSVKVQTQINIEKKEVHQNNNSTMNKNRLTAQQQVAIDNWNYNAQLAFKQGNPRRAEDYFRKILVLNPYDPYVRNDLAAVLKHQRRLKESEYEFLRAIELKPDYITAMANLGVIRHEMYNFEGAKEMYELVLKVDSNNLNAIYNLGNYYRDTRQSEKAIDVYVKHLDLNYEGHDYIVLLAMMKIFSVDEINKYKSLRNIAEKYLMQNKFVHNKLNITHEVQRFSGRKYDEAIDNLCKLSQEIGLFKVHYDVDSGLPTLVKTLLKSKNNIDDAERGLMPSLFSSNDNTAKLHVENQAPNHIHLLVQYYLTVDKERQYEIDLVLFYNLVNPFIYKIHIFMEKNDRNWKQFFIDKYTSSNSRIFSRSNDFKNMIELINHKIQIVLTSGERLRFDMAIDYSYQHIHKKLGEKNKLGGVIMKDIIVLSNVDIIFDSSINLSKNVREGEVFALLRWEMVDIDDVVKQLALRDGDDKIGLDSNFDSMDICVNKIANTDIGSKYNSATVKCIDKLKKTLKLRMDQQDVWIFHSNLFEKIDNISLFNFALGRPRCDNRVAMALTEEGILVRNPAFEISTLHIQKTKRRKYTNNDQVPGALKYVPIDFL